MMELTYDEAFKAFYQGIVGYCLSRLPNEPCSAEDLASECFVLLFRKWDSLQSHSAAAVQVWLLRAARNKTMDYIKKKRLHTVSIDDEETRDRVELELLHLRAEVDEQKEHERYHRYLAQLREILSAEEWALFDLVVNREASFREVAERLNMTEAAAKMRWYRLRAKLKLKIRKLFEQNVI